MEMFSVTDQFVFLLALHTSAPGSSRVGRLRNGQWGFTGS